MGERPRTTTTPRPVPLVRALVGRHDVGTTGGHSADNRAYMPPDFLVAAEEAYGGTRLGREELDGELIEEVEGALWTRDLIKHCRVRVALDVVRVVVGVDPPVGSGPGTDARVDALLQASVVAVSVNDPPVAPIAGQCWIVGDAPSGTWAGQPRSLAVWTDDGWRMMAPLAGMVVWSAADGVFARFGGAAWSPGAMSSRGACWWGRARCRDATATDF